VCTAGISRPTFCFCFVAKDAVQFTLLDRVEAEAEDDVVDVLREVWPRVIQGTAPADWVRKRVTGEASPPTRR
jgi:hypothetical protein